MRLSCYLSVFKLRQFSWGTKLLLFFFFFFTSSVATNKAKGKASDDPCNRSVITMLKAVKGLDPLILVE